MTEEQAHKAKAQAREFPETLEIMGRIRAALAARLFKTPLAATQEREDIYLRVQTLDAMNDEMASLLAANAGEKAIAEYIESIATTGEK